MRDDEWKEFKGKYSNEFLLKMILRCLGMKQKSYRVYDGILIRTCCRFTEDEFKRFYKRVNRKFEAFKRIEKSRTYSWDRSTAKRVSDLFAAYFSVGFRNEYSNIQDEELRFIAELGAELAKMI